MARPTSFTLALEEAADGKDGVEGRVHADRAPGALSTKLEVGAEDVVELDFLSAARGEGHREAPLGRLILRAGDLHELSLRQGATATSGALALPATRGIASQIAIRVIRQAAPAGIDKVAQAYENTSSGSTRIVSAAQLHSVDATSETAEIPDDGPTLVMVHGTASSARGAFGALSGEKRPAEPWQRMVEAYDGQVFALQHRTLTESPIDNALVLAHGIAGKGPVDLVSHSRGGLVAEILSIAGSLTPAALAQWVRNCTGRRPSETELHKLAQLHALRDDLNIRRLVRVAAPIAGTSLLSRRVDVWVNVLFNLVQAASGWAGAEVVRVLALELVRQLRSVDVLPGLESMVPGAPTSRLLTSGLKGAGELIAVAGNARRPGFWPFLQHLVPTAFFHGRNDLIVETSSMGHGTRADPVRLIEHRARKDDRLWHITYFRSPRVQSDLEHSLQGIPTSTPNRGSLVSAADLFGAGIQGTYGDSGPLVILLPGIMGSHLHVKNDRIWIDPGSLIGGGFAKLDPKKKPRVHAPEAMRAPYVKLARWLGRRCRVQIFPYDWRLSLDVLADRLEAVVTAGLNQQPERPVRLLAHSMGGLVARAMIGKYPALWKRIKDRDGRLVMLGTPNQGAIGMVRLLTGGDPSFEKLDQFDWQNDAETLLSIIHRMPGPLSMVPQQAVDGIDFTKRATWKNVVNARTKIPVNTDVKAFRALRVDHALLAAGIDVGAMVYVAGRSREPTPAVLNITPDGAWSFEGDLEGDGTVPWEAGRLSKGGNSMRMWITDVAHGSLANHRPAFEGILDLLEHGTTQRLGLLSTQTQRGGTPQRFALESGGVLTSDLENLTAGWVGCEASDQVLYTLAVSLGDVVLTHPELPLLVPIEAGRRLSSAVLDIDEALEGALADRVRVGTFTGAAGEVLPLTLPATADHRSERRALLVGVGPGSMVTRASLVRVLVRALTECSLSWPTEQALRVAPFGRGVQGVDWVDAVFEACVRTRRLLADDGNLGGIRTLRFTELDQAQGRMLHQHVQLIASSPTIALRPEERIYAVSRLANLELTLSREEEFLEGIPAQIGATSMARISRPTAYWSVRSSALHREQIRFEISSSTGRAAGRTAQVTVSRATIAAHVQSLEAGSDRDNERFLQGYVLTPELIRAFGNGQDVLLSLDAEAARFPWEILLSTDMPGGNQATARLGMMRALIDTPSYTPKVPTGHALVIGAPGTGEGHLPGVVRELDEVCRTLGEHFEVTRPESTGFAVRSMFGRTWDVLHLCGHGVYDADRPDRTGFVLDDGTLLTAADLRAMSGRFPALVFLNACHSSASGEFDRPAHAGSLARACMAAGARAVVAAGWAIDDRAALDFARTFYTRSIEGLPLSRAASRARAQAVRASPQSNTWAAYQIYGEPEFVLPGVLAGGGGLRGLWAQIPDPDDREGATDALTVARILLDRHRRGLGGESSATLQRQLELWQRACPASLLRDSEVGLVVARLWFALGRPSGALPLLQSLETDGLCRSMQQLMNATAEPEERRDLRSMQRFISVDDQGFELVATVEDGTIENRERVGLHLSVKGPAAAHGVVFFHLHPTFPVDTMVQELRAGQAGVRIFIWDTFVVRAEVQLPGRASIVLTLDLQDLLPTPLPA